MKLPIMLILLGAAAPALAQTQAQSQMQTQDAPDQPSQPTPVAQNGPIKPAAQLQSPQARKKQVAAARNWSLDKAVKKKPGQKGQQQTHVAGPAMPPEPVVKVPRQRTAAAAPKQEKKTRVNAGPLVSTILRKKND